METLKTFAKKFSNDWSMNLAGMLAYSLITTIFPLLLGILSIAGIILHFLSPGALNSVADTMSKALPSQMQSAIDTKSLLHNLVKITGPIAIVSLLGLIWAGSNLFTNMENAFSIVFRTGDRNFFPQKLMAIGMVIILAILLPLSVGASSFVTAGSQAFRSVIPQPLGIVLTFVGPLTSLLILWVLFLIIYKVVPNIDVPFRDAWRGAVAAAILFAIFDTLFPLYFKFFLSGNSKYGALAATALVMVVWLWFFALITLIGAQINAVAMGIRPTRYDLARTLCEDYQQNTAPQEPARSPRPRRGGRVQAGTSGPARGAASSSRGAGSTIAYVLTAPLRALALVSWLAARPLVHRAAQRERRGRDSSWPTGPVASSQ